MKLFYFIFVDTKERVYIWFAITDFIFFYKKKMLDGKNKKKIELYIFP